MNTTTSTGQNESAVFYLSPNGCDQWTGKMPAPAGDRSDGPFATLERARDAVRELKKRTGLPPGGVSVILRGGIYPMSQGLDFGPDDSGTGDVPIVYRAADGETVRILGGRLLDPAAFIPVSDPAVRSRLAEPARDQVVQIDLRGQGIDDLGAFLSRGFQRPTTPAHLELFFNDQPMTVAQWPNAGEFTTITGYMKTKVNEWKAESGELTGGFMYAGDRPRAWSPSDDIWVHGYWAWDWANSYERVSRLDPERRIVETAEPYGLYHFTKGQRFYFLNVLEELDQPGEYYLDREHGILYFWPPAPMAGADVLVSVVSAPLINLNWVSHIQFRDLILEAGRGSAMEALGGEALLVSGCIIRNAGNWAIRIDGGTLHTIDSCEIYGTGDGGIKIDGGDRRTLTPCGHTVINCHIHHFARWSRCYVTGILAGGVGMRFAHNLIHDAPHTAILFSGNDFTVECNEIHHVCLETGDAGAIYTGRDYTFRGNVIRRNFIHHMGGVGMGSMAIYMDDCVSGTRIEENILWKCQYGIMLGGGRDFVVANNVFVDCRPAIHADARGIDPNPVWQNMVKNIMKENLDAMRHHEPPYRDRYPEIAEVDRYYAADQGVPPENNAVERNIVYRCAPWIGACWPAGAHNGITEKNNLIGPVPGFIDPDNGDFRLQPDSPALLIGFKPIAIHTIGPQKLG